MAAKTTAHRLRQILARFSDGRSVIATACKALDESDHCIDEVATIRAGLEMLAGVYNELDSTIIRLRTARRAGSSGLCRR